MNRYERLGDLMGRRGVDAIVLRRPANFAWYTGGADSKVDHVAAEGVADLIVRPGSELVLTSTIEAPRMRAEQTPDLEVAEYPWYEDRGAALRGLVGAARIGSDIGLPGTVDLSDEVARLRILGAQSRTDFIDLHKAHDQLVPGIDIQHTIRPSPVLDRPAPFILRLL